MTGAGGAVITPRMLDVLSSGGATNGQAPAQGPYLKIRWAVGSPEDDGIGEGGRGGTGTATMEVLGSLSQDSDG
ncbi:hypothetical protein THAOC_32025 [Thalassiosira oceanica]|uniref:Uncharacterized protein n=1 Tax=Thalassiosira oceanica TaxID=159749 RepID=K0RA72_THAOC|nr:hypothetical protein THAOC_32025 [Thalassiosira oceanica]|eukprot:EJK49129.1 hypothetical protein THAOC_32025 [Thalassiosira oceanica]